MKSRPAIPLLALLMACSGDEPGPVAVEPVDGPTEPAEAPPEPVPPARTAPAGPLWLQTQAGLYRVDASGGTQVSGLSDEIKGWTLDPSGTPWVFSGGALWKVEGTAAIEVSKAPQEHVLLYLEELAVGADGTVWGAGPKALASFDGTSWSSVPEDQLGPNSTLLTDVQLAPDGTVYAHTDKVVVVGKDGAWTVQDLTEVEPGIEFLDDLTLTPDGAAWVSYRGEAKGVMVLRDGTWSPAGFVVGFDQAPETLAVDPDGKLVAIGSEEHQLVRDVTGQAAVIDLREAELLSWEVEGIAVDALNRIWARTNKGLVVAGEDGSLAEYTPGTNGLPAEPILRLAVHAGGPQLGAAAEVSEAVQGRILLDEQPIADSEILLCDTSDLLFTEHPCEKATVRIEGKTDAEGRFVFPAVKQDRYHLLVKLEKWTSVIGAGCCSDMKPGQALVLDDIELSSD